MKRVVYIRGEGWPLSSHRKHRIRIALTLGHREKSLEDERTQITAESLSKQEKLWFSMPCMFFR